MNIITLVYISEVSLGTGVTKLSRFTLIGSAVVAIVLAGGCSNGLQTELRGAPTASTATGANRNASDDQQSDGGVPQSVSGTNFTRLLLYGSADFQCELATGDFQMCRAVNRLASGLVEKEISGFSDVRSVTWYIGQDEHGGSACETQRNGLDLKCRAATISDAGRVRMIVTHLDGTRRTVGSEPVTPQVTADLAKLLQDGRGYAIFLAGPASGTAAETGDTRDMLDQACEDAGNQMIKAGPLAAARLNRFKALVAGKEEGDESDKIPGFKSDWPVVTMSSAVADNGASGTLLPVAGSLKNFWLPQPGTVLTNQVQGLADGTPAPVGSVVWTGKSVQSDGSVVKGQTCPGWSSSGPSGSASAAGSFGSIGVIGEITGARWLASGMVQECGTAQAMVYCLAYRKIQISTLAGDR